MIELLKYIWTLPVIFGAAFWLSILWRRVTPAAAWSSVAFSLLFSFVLPVLLPLSDSIATRESLLATTAPASVEVRVGADSTDVTAGLAVSAGELITKWLPVPSTPVYFQQLRTTPAGELRGESKFRTGVWLLTRLGFDFSRSTRATLEAATFLMDAILPFIVLLAVSLLSAPVARGALDRFYARLLTPVHADLEIDRRHLEASLADPASLQSRLWFPRGGWMMQKPDRADILGFIAATLVAVAIVGVVFLVAGIRWP